MDTTRRHTPTPSAHSPKSHGAALLPAPQRRRSGHRRRALAGALLAFVLVATSCGGDDDDGSAAATSSGSTDSGSSSTSGSTSDGGSSGGGSSLALNAAALNTNPITAADVRLYRPDENVLRLPRIDAVVNTCDVLSASTVSDVASQLSAEESFGETIVFEDGELLTSRCTFKSSTHVLSVYVGAASEMEIADLDFLGPIARGEITATPWADNPTISILSEDSFDLDTPYAAHVFDGDYGILVHNSGGTGIDFGSDGTMFARLADAAIGNAQTAGPAVPVDPAENIQTASPCFWTIDELRSALGIDLPDIVFEPNSDQASCTYGEGGVTNSVQVDIKAPTGSIAPSNFELSADGVATTFNSAYFFATDDAVVQVRIDVRGDDGFINQDIDTMPAMAALAENLASRYVG